MSQIASFYLLKDGRRQELSNGDCSGAVYMAIWDWCESELDLDVRFPAPQTEDTLDCALLEGELASKLLAALRERDLPELAAEIAPDWDLPTEAVQSGLETLRSHLELVQGDAALGTAECRAEAPCSDFCRGACCRCIPAGHRIGWRSSFF